MIPESQSAILSVNWWGILFASVGLALILTLYNVYTSSWSGRAYRKGSAAPQVGHTPLGGKIWWRSRVSVFPLVILLCYLGAVCLFVQSFWFTGLAVWWFASAAVVIGLLWIHPIFIRRAEKTEIDKQKADSDSLNAGYPSGDSADYVVVSPYEPADSDQRPWWKPRKR